MWICNFIFYFLNDLKIPLHLVPPMIGLNSIWVGLDLEFGFEANEKLNLNSLHNFSPYVCVSKYIFPVALISIRI